MKRIKKLLCLLLSLSMLASLCTGCGNSAGQKEKAKKMAFPCPTTPMPRWSADSEITPRHSHRQAGYEVNIQFAGNDAAAQVQQIQDMIGAGCTTIIAAAVDPSRLAADLALEDTDRQRISGGSAEDEAEDTAHSPIDDGLNLIAYQTLIADSGIVDYYVGFDGYEAGYLQAKLH